MSHETKGAHVQNEQQAVQLDFSSPQDCSIALEMAASALREKLVGATSAEAAKALQEDKQSIEDRVVDVMVSLLCLGEVCDIDLDQAFEKRCKLESHDCEDDSCCSDHDCEDDSCCTDEECCASECCSEDE